MLQVILTAIGYMVNLLEIMILISCVLSWFPMGNNAFTNFVAATTEPILKPIRNMLYKSPLGGPGMMLDFSPIIACFLLSGVYQTIMAVIG